MRGKKYDFRPTTIGRHIKKKIANTAQYRRFRRRRKKAEIVFAHLERVLKLDRLRLHGLGGAQDEFAAAVQNLRRLALLIPNAPLLVGIGAPARSAVATVEQQIAWLSPGAAVGELETTLRYKVPLPILLFANASCDTIKASQRTSYRERYFSVGSSRTGHARIAAEYGVKS